MEIVQKIKGVDTPKAIAEFELTMNDLSEVEVRCNGERLLTIATKDGKLGLARVLLDGELQRITKLNRSGYIATMTEIAHI